MTNPNDGCCGAVSTALLKTMLARIDAARQSTIGALALSDHGDLRQAARILLDAEEPIFEASKLLEAVIAVSRIGWEAAQ